MQGPVGSPTVVERSRVDLIGADVPRQPFHAAKGLSRREAERLVGWVETASHALAADVLADLVARHGIIAVGVTLGSGRRPPDDMGRVLASHAAQHSAEGWLYRDALLEAAHERGLTAVGVPEPDLDEPWAAALGRGLGPPWAKDQKLAACVAHRALK
jgi:hypothetical protein